MINRCIDQTIDSELKTKAFKIARDNMEELLGEYSVSEMTEFGSPEENPDIEWELTVEPFTEPLTNEIWMRAVSSASYSGSSGDRESVKLIHWLTDLTEHQVKQLQQQKALELEMMDEIMVNPYGDDPEGLMMFQESLASEGKFIQSIKIALDLIRQYPDTDEAIKAAKDARMYARKSASFGDYGSASDVVIKIATLIDDPATKKECIADALKYSTDAAKSEYYDTAAKIAERLRDELDVELPTIVSGNISKWKELPSKEPPVVTDPSGQNPTGGNDNNNNNNNPNNNKDLQIRPGETLADYLDRIMRELGMK